MRHKAISYKFLNSNRNNKRLMCYTIGISLFAFFLLYHLLSARSQVRRWVYLQLIDPTKAALFTGSKIFVFRIPTFSFSNIYHILHQRTQFLYYLHHCAIKGNKQERKCSIYLLLTVSYEEYSCMVAFSKSRLNKSRAYYVLGFGRKSIFGGAY